VNSHRKISVENPKGGKVDEGSNFDEFGATSVIIEELPDEEHTDSDVDQKLSAINEEEVKYKVPINLLLAAKNILRYNSLIFTVFSKVKKLPKDEYGDAFYDGENPDDKWSQKLKRAGEIMMFWLKKLFNANDEKEMDKIQEDMKRHVITYDKSFQVNFSMKVEKPPEELKIKFIETKNSIGGSSTVRSGKKKRGKQIFTSKGRKSMYFPPKEAPSPANTLSQVTESVPFNFQTISKKMQKSYNSGLLKYIQVFK